MPRSLPSWDAALTELEPFSRATLVVTDIDGTLVMPEARDVGQSISDVQRRLRRYRKNQVVLTVATGRTLAGVQPILNALELRRGTPMILYNGSVIVTYLEEHLLLRKIIPIEICNRILDRCWRTRATVRTYTIYDDHVDSPLEPLREQVRGWGLQAKEPNQMPVIDLPVGRPYDDIVGPSAILISLDRDGSSSGDRLRAFLARLSEVTVTSSGSSFLEIRPAGSNKGAALAVLTAHLGVALQNTIAIGDNDNDAELLATAGIGVVVSGSSAGASTAADYVCRLGAAKGTLEVLRLIKESRRYFPSAKSKREEVL